MPALEYVRKCQLHTGAGAHYFFFVPFALCKARALTTPPKRANSSMNQANNLDMYKLLCTQVTHTFFFPKNGHEKII